MGLKTPLFEEHKALGATFTEYAGYTLPVQYADVAEEHMAVRGSAGLFDVSHMGELILRGAGALANLNYICTNDFTDMTDGSARYSLICNDHGGTVDDIIVYRFSNTRYFIVCNAANRQKVFEHLASHLQGSVFIKDDSEKYAQLALQGPKSRDILLKLTDKENIPQKYYSFIEDAAIAGISCLISRTGYTGEHGYEILCTPDSAVKLWRGLLDAGSLPCGLGARDTLRLEAGMPLYGHEIDENITPFEAGLGFAVSMSKTDFIGKEALKSPRRIRAGLKVTGKGIIREGCPVLKNETETGIATSGTWLPYLKGAYAMALVNISDSAIGTSVEADVRGRRVPAEIVPLPFYKREEK